MVQLQAIVVRRHVSSCAFWLRIDLNEFLAEFYKSVDILWVVNVLNI